MVDHSQNPRDWLHLDNRHSISVVIIRIKPPLQNTPPPCFGAIWDSGLRFFFDWISSFPWEIIIFDWKKSLKNDVLILQIFACGAKKLKNKGFYVYRCQILSNRENHGNPLVFGEKKLSFFRFYRSPWLLGWFFKFLDVLNSPGRVLSNFDTFCDNGRLFCANDRRFGIATDCKPVNLDGQTVLLGHGKVW